MGILIVHCCIPLVSNIYYFSNKFRQFYVLEVCSYLLLRREPVFFSCFPAPSRPNSPDPIHWPWRPRPVSTDHISTVKPHKPQCSWQGQLPSLERMLTFMRKHFLRHRQNKMGVIAQTCTSSPLQTKQFVPGHKKNPIKEIPNPQRALRKDCLEVYSVPV